MQLEHQDAKALEQLIQQERAWRWFRIVLLALGIVFIALGGWLAWDAKTRLLEATRNMSPFEQPSGRDVYLAVIAGAQLPLTAIMASAGGALIGAALALWRGIPMRRLLIALASDRESQSVEPDS